jgi:beta-glucosidase-like glycosyl hydrolase
MIRLCGTISLWIARLVFLFVGANINEPDLVSLRGLGAAALFVASNVVFVVLIRRGYRNGRGAVGRLLILLWGLPSLAMLNAHISFEVSNQRAISGDPAAVTDIGLAYIRGLDAFGVAATVKHFPGLGRVRADTDHFSADLDTPLAVLEASDWRPFRDVLADSRAQLMIGHVTLTAVDPDRPASHSKLIVNGIIRQKWNYQGVIITDDLVMGASYSRSICTAVLEALNAGVDLLLVAFDGSQFYRIFACASDAFAQGKLDAAMLRQSEARLERTLPSD